MSWKMLFSIVVFGGSICTILFFINGWKAIGASIIVCALIMAGVLWSERK